MRNISVTLTQQQIEEQTKFVTRRLKWQHLKVGELLQPVQKGMGLAAGEKMHRIGPPIRVTNVRRERLNVMAQAGEYGRFEARREGFPDMTGQQFVDFFCKGMDCKADDEVTRICFEYTFTAQECRQAAIMHDMGSTGPWQHASTHDRTCWMDAVRNGKKGVKV